MRELMQHAGGFGWTGSGMWIMITVAIVLVGAVIWYRKRNRYTSSDGRKWRTIIKFGRPLVAYDEDQLCAERAEAMAKNLWQFHDKAWHLCDRVYQRRAQVYQKLQQIYGKKIKTKEPSGKSEDLILSRIILNATLTEDGRPKAIKMYRRAGHIHMRPTGTVRMYTLFALEVHQLYRAWAIGFNDYDKPDTGDYADLMNWKQMVAFCKEEARRYA